jgi:uncharacterized protein YndB with AHSA1/START domain
MTSRHVGGAMSTNGETGTVVVSSVFATTPEDLWHAVTSPERLRRWFGEITPQPGQAHSFDASLTTGWAGRISVTRCEPPTDLSAELCDDDAATTVNIHLAPTDEGTQLTIEEHGLEPQGLHNYVAGWHAQLDQLHATLQHAADVPWRDRWDQLREHYRTQTVR